MGISLYSFGSSFLKTGYFSISLKMWKIFQTVGISSILVLWGPEWQYYLYQFSVLLMPKDNIPIGCLV